MEKEIIFLFDLDGTITQRETLPIIAKYFNIEDQINDLTIDTVNGNLPFMESFIQRVNILGELPISKINRILKEVELFLDIISFIEKNSNQCAIITGNIDVWIEGLLKRIKCRHYTSKGMVENDSIIKLTSILKKEDIVKKYQAEGKTVVVVGDGNNDMEAMRLSDISIACGLVHYPSTSILTIADYCVFDEKALCRLLSQIKDPQKGQSLVLSCAGIGSRLGLNTTKALIEIENKKLIHLLLEMFEELEDVRIVIGYQAAKVMKEVLKVRKDVIFVYNHEYFSTKTGTSFYLGARHGNAYAIAWDGDLLVHPTDVKRCLNYKGEYIGCSETVTEDGVFAKINENHEVVSFSRHMGDLEWSGPAKMKKENIKYVSSNVFNQIEEHLPMPLLKISAQDIDTYDDYIKAKEFVRSWNGK